MYDNYTPRPIGRLVFLGTNHHKLLPVDWVSRVFQTRHARPPPIDVRTLQLKLFEFWEYTRETFIAALIPRISEPGDSLKEFHNSFKCFPLSPALASRLLHYRLIFLFLCLLLHFLRRLFLRLLFLRLLPQSSSVPAPVPQIHQEPNNRIEPTREHALIQNQVREVSLRHSSKSPSVSVWTAACDVDSGAIAWCTSLGHG